MIITGIETFPLRIPFKPGNRSAASAWGPKGLDAVDSLLVKVTTDQGLEGWGESFGFTGVPVTQRAIDAVIAPLCVGQDATHTIRGPATGFFHTAVCTVLPCQVTSCGIPTLTDSRAPARSPEVTTSSPSHASGQPDRAAPRLREVHVGQTSRTRNAAATVTHAAKATRA